MYTPPRCPNDLCLYHRDPIEGFFQRDGHYLAACRSRPVPRFRCKRCGKRFSRQTFRADYRDKKPHLNAPMFRLLASGLGLRQSARMLNISRHCLEMKFRKYGKHLLQAHRNLTGKFSGINKLMLDEMETFETNRRTRPVTVPVLIHADSMFVIDADVAPIRPSGRMNDYRRQLIAMDEKRNGIRRNGSPASIERVMRSALRALGWKGRAVLVSDEKTTYPVIAKRVFGDQLVGVKQYSSKLPRNTENPLFRINLTNAMARDLNGRLRRRSWLVSKLRKFLRCQLGYFMAYRNYVRVRFNQEKKTPAQHHGFRSRPLKPEELLGWRQDWGDLSPPIPGGVHQ